MTLGSSYLVRYSQHIKKGAVIGVPFGLIKRRNVGNRRFNLLIRVFDPNVEFGDVRHKIAFGDVDFPLDELIKKRFHGGFELGVDEFRKGYGRCRALLGNPLRGQQGAHDVEILLQAHALCREMVHSVLAGHVEVVVDGGPRCERRAGELLGRRERIEFAVDDRGVEPFEDGGV